MKDQIYKYHRFSIRLTDYDYSQPGYYFITLVTQNRGRLFGVIYNKQMQLNKIGRMVEHEWEKIPKRFRYVVLDKYIIMPDHFHGIIQIISKKKIFIRKIYHYLKLLVHLNRLQPINILMV